MAIQHYKECLLNEEKIGGQNPNSQSPSISKIYAETFMKLFNTKMQCCDWNNYYDYVDNLKKIIMKQYGNGDLPCIDPFSMFMLDFRMEDKLIISKKWAESEKIKAFQDMKRDQINF